MLYTRNQVKQLLDAAISNVKDYVMDNDGFIDSITTPDKDAIFRQGGQWILQDYMPEMKEGPYVCVNVDKFTGYKYKPFLAEYKDGILKSSLNGLVLTKSDDQDRYLLYIGEEEGRGTVPGAFKIDFLFMRGDIVKSKDITVLVTEDMKANQQGNKVFEGTAIDGPKGMIGRHTTQWFYTSFVLTGSHRVGSAYMGK